MRRTLVLLITVLFASLFGVPAASAGSAHFINSAFSITQDGATVTVSAKEAGLGDEPQIHVVLTADAACINPGDHHPKAANKESFSSAADVPVQNGKADYTLTLTATFQPDCTPPMTLVFSNIVLTDETNNLVHRF
jgi:hypothetical protein